MKANAKQCKINNRDGCIECHWLCDSYISKFQCESDDEEEEEEDN